MNSDHVSLETLSALVDGELTDHDGAAMRTHLNECHDCSRKAIEAFEMRLATKRAALCNTPSAEILARLNSQLRPDWKQSTRLVSYRAVAWQIAAAVLLTVIFLAAWKWIRQSSSIAGEMLDQHLATLSEASQPQVVSSDRHTVKPWFEGKLPFSFNLPEPNTLPVGTVLTGANLTYVRGKPAALLFFMIHKHRASVFVMQDGQFSSLLTQRTRSGFQLVTAESSGLNFLGVSDVNVGELSVLMRVLAAAQ